MRVGLTEFSQDYLNSIKNEAFPRIDSKDRYGNGDGKITVDEVYKDLEIGRLFYGLKEDSDEYNRLKTYTDRIPEAIVEYSGEDEEFTPEEWAKFLNGEEWGDVIDAYHSSSNFAQLEMGWIDNQGIQDGILGKGEVKVGILNNIAQSGRKFDTTEIEAIVDKYAGDDGIFSVEEYTALKNDETYSTFLKENCVSPLYKKEEIEEKPVNTKQSLKQTFKTIMKNMVEKFTSLFK